jgi:hypothetical protein
MASRSTDPTRSRCITPLQSGSYVRRRRPRPISAASYVSLTRVLSEWWQFGHSNVRFLYSGLWGSIRAGIIIVPHFGQDGRLVAIEAGVASRKPSMQFSFHARERYVTLRCVRRAPSKFFADAKGGTGNGRFDALASLPRNRATISLPPVVAGIVEIRVELAGLPWLVAPSLCCS